MPAWAATMPPCLTATLPPGWRWSAPTPWGSACAPEKLCRYALHALVSAVHQLVASMASTCLAKNWTSFRELGRTVLHRVGLHNRCYSGWCIPDPQGRPAKPCFAPQQTFRGCLRGQSLFKQSPCHQVLVLVTNLGLCFAALFLCHAGYAATRTMLVTNLRLCFAVLVLCHAGYEAARAVGSYHSHLFHGRIPGTLPFRCLLFSHQARLEGSCRGPSTRGTPCDLLKLPMQPLTHVLVIAWYKPV